MCAVDSVKIAIQPSREAAVINRLIELLKYKAINKRLVFSLLDLIVYHAFIKNNGGMNDIDVSETEGRRRDSSEGLKRGL
jgi:hypothetical protein